MIASIALVFALQQPSVPPVRQLGPIIGVSKDSLSSVAAAVPVAGGRIFVNDILARRVLLYDSTLSGLMVVADSASGSANAYGARPGTLLAFRGDSALLITPAAQSMLVLGPTGQITRVMAMPPSGGPMGGALIGNIFGTPGFDAQGRLAYFSPIRMEIRRGPGSDGGGPGGPAPRAIEPPDSAYLVRFDFAARTLDTAAVIKIQSSRSTMSRDADGRFHMTMTAVPPLPIDDWAVLADGSIAVVRGRDYHVDRLNADGSWSRGPRIPFEWERLDDSTKAALLDSVATAMQVNMDSMQARLTRTGPQTGPAGNTASAGRDGTGGGAIVMTFTGPPPGGAGERGPGAGGGGPQTVSFPAPQVVKANLADVPDYRPPFRQAAVRADADGHLWIRTTKMVDGRPVYDIVDRDGQLIDRVQLPAFRTIAGFGPGVVYMGVRDDAGVMHVEKARIR